MTRIQRKVDSIRESVKMIIVSATLAVSVQQIRSNAILKPNKPKKLQTRIQGKMDSMMGNVKTAIASGTLTVSIQRADSN